jgi:hypothetical protein
MLPNKSTIKAGLQNLMQDGFLLSENIKKLSGEKSFSQVGDIDVLYYDKLDKDNFIKEQYWRAFNDAHAALRPTLAVH